MDNYLEILQESLVKKREILDCILEISQKQIALLEGPDMTLEKYDQYVDRKSECIERLQNLDEGFEILYEKISEALSQNRERYADQIHILQGLIREVTERSVSIQAMEARNKKQVEEYFRKERKLIQSARISSKAAMDYYENVNRLKYVEAQFLDKKK